MKTTLSVDDCGELTLPAEFLGNPEPGTAFEVTLHHDGIITLQRAPAAAGQKPFWEVASPQERADAFVRWVDGHKPEGPGLSDEALRRENMYD